MPNDGFRTIKIYMSSYEKLQELMEQLAQEGWASIGSGRRDEMTLSNVLDEVIKLTLSKGHKK